MQLYVVAYDISDNRARRQVDRLLSRKGIRIQRSVFEIMAQPAQLRRLLQKAEQLLGPADSVVAYRLTYEREGVGALLPAIDNRPISLV